MATKHDGHIDATAKENDYGNEHSNSNMNANDAAERILTAGSISISHITIMLNGRWVEGKLFACIRICGA